MVTATRERLTPRQRLFVDAVAQGRNHSDAARFAGYTGSSAGSAGSRMANVPHVQDAISRARTSYLVEKEWTLEHWRAELNYQYRRTRDTDTPSAVRILELAGKHLGAFEHSGDANGAAEALALLKALAGLSVSARLPSAAVAPLTIEARVSQALSPSQAEQGSQPPSE